MIYIKIYAFSLPERMSVLLAEIDLGFTLLFMMSSFKIPIPVIPVQTGIHESLRILYFCFFVGIS